MRFSRERKCFWIFILFTIIFTAYIFLVLNQWFCHFVKAGFDNDRSETDNEDRYTLSKSDVGYETGEKTEHQHINILLFAYQRTASSFVGHIIGCRKDTFYFYEPFWKIATHTFYNGSQECSNSNFSCRPRKDSMDHVDLLHSLYDCQGSAISKLISQVQSENSCKLNKDVFRTNDTEQIRNICVNAKIRVLKVLRISADILEGMIQRNQEMKIIYLFRDPRAIVTSRSKTFRTELVKLTCNRMDFDGRQVLKLAENYPKNVALLSADRIAKNPIAISKLMFNFLGLSWKLFDEEQIKELSGLKSKHKTIKERKFSPFKNDGYAASMKWRSTLSMEHKTKIDQICQHVYDRFGFLTLSSEREFRNISFLNIREAKSHRYQEL